MARAMPLRRGTTWSAQAMVRASRDGKGVSAPAVSDSEAGPRPGGTAGARAGGGGGPGEARAVVGGGPDALAAGSVRRARVPRAARAVALAAGAGEATGAGGA